MPGERQHQAQIGPRGAEHAGNMQQRLAAGDIHQPPNRAFGAVAVQPLVELGLPLAQALSQRNRGLDIGARIVRVAVGYAVGGAEILQAKTGQAVFAARPLKALRAQGVGGAQGVDDIPARAPGAELTRVGIAQIAIQGKAGQRVVETQGVVTQAAGARPGQFGFDGGDKFGLTNAPGLGLLRGEASHQAGLGMGEVVARRAHEQAQGRPEGVQIEVGALTGKLQRAIVAGVGAPGFVVVPVKRFRDAQGPALRSRQAGPLLRTDTPRVCTATLIGMCFNIVCADYLHLWRPQPPVGAVCSARRLA